MLSDIIGKNHFCWRGQVIMKKWMIAYGTHITAAERLCAAVSDYADWKPVCAEKPLPDFNCITLSTDESIPGVRISVSEAGGENGEDQSINICGHDEENLLYAVSDFRNIYLPSARYAGDHFSVYYLRDLFETPFPPYEYSSEAQIKRRGIWLWGYTIYDYRRFIDNMASLKLNTLIIWNDILPINISELIEYAHKNFVRIYLGFEWGWDTHMPDKLSEEFCDDVSRRVISTYESEYAALGCDGIYFQTFTEGMPEYLDGTPVIDTAVDMINKTSAQLISAHPGLEILFGLHAGCALGRLEALRALDPRVSIIWEDAGAFPYAYMPNQTEGFAETLQTTEKIRDLRDGGFGAVMKGVTALNWRKFEHQRGAFSIGASGRKFIRRRTEEKREILRGLQAVWLKNAHYALEVIKKYPADSMVTCLVEDGMFEEIVNFPTALYASMLWDPNRPISDIISETAMREDVDFV